MTVRFRHPQTGEVFEGKLTRIFPHVHSLGVFTDHETVVHLDNVIFVQCAPEPKVIA